jgi:hypothetical protein
MSTDWLSGPRPEGDVWGMQIKADTTRAGVIDDGCVAWEERVVEASRQWPRGRLEDFEWLGKKTWRDRATQVEYVQVPGAPLLSIGTDATRDISLFLVVDGKLVFLRRADAIQGTVIHHGPVRSGRVEGNKVVWSS